MKWCACTVFICVIILNARDSAFMLFNYVLNLLQNSWEISFAFSIKYFISNSARLSTSNTYHYIYIYHFKNGFSEVFYFISCIRCNIYSPTFWLSDTRQKLSIHFLLIYAVQEGGGGGHQEISGNIFFSSRLYSLRSSFIVWL